MRMMKIFALVAAFGLTAWPQLAKAEGNYIQVGFSADAQLDQYRAQEGFSYYAVGSVDGSAVQDRDGNTWPGHGVVAVAFEPTGDGAADAVENVVASVAFLYGPTPAASITFADGIDVEAAASKLGLATCGLTSDIDVIPGGLPAQSWTVNGRTLTIDTGSAVMGGDTPVDIKLTFVGFTTPENIPVGTFFIWSRAFGSSGVAATQNPELTRLDVYPATANLRSAGVLRVTFDEAVRINQTPSQWESLEKINFVPVKAASSADTVKVQILHDILHAYNDAAWIVTTTEVVDAIAAAGSSHLLSVDLNGNDPFMTVEDGGDFTPDPVAPVIAAISDQTITAGFPYAGSVPSLSAGTLPVIWSLDSAAAGMTIDDATGVVSWPSPVAGYYAVTIRATNGAGYDDVSWQLTVTAQPSGETVLTDGATVTGYLTDLRLSNNITVANNGFIRWVTLGSGSTLVNNGTVVNAILGANAVIRGGTVRGTLTGTGAGATVQNAVIDAAPIVNVTIGSGCTITAGSAAGNPGLDLTAAVTNDAGRIPVNAPILADPATGTSRSLRDIMRNAVNAALGDSTSDVQEDAAGTPHLRSRNLGNIDMLGRIGRVETTDRPDGAEADADGLIVIRTSRIAVTLVPASHNAQAFQEALAALVVVAEESPNGMVTIRLPGVGRAALRFSSLIVVPETASIARVQTTFGMAGDPSELDAFHLVAIYPDGATQAMLPFIHDLARFAQFVRAGGMSYRVDPFTGAFQLMNVAGGIVYRGIPDYRVSDPPAETTAVSIESDGDVNGDGLVDFYLLTPTGRQLVYTLPLS